MRGRQTGGVRQSGIGVCEAPHGFSIGGRHRYLDAFTSADLDAARALVADDFSFNGPMMQVQGRDAFFEGAAGLAPIVRGYEMLRQWEDGNDVCSVYEFKVATPAGAGSITMSEWNTVRDGQLASARLVFDTAAFNALMPG